MRAPPPFSLPCTLLQQHAMSRSTPRITPVAAASPTSARGGKSPKAWGATSPTGVQLTKRRSGDGTARGNMSARGASTSRTATARKGNATGRSESKTAPDTERTVRFEDEDEMTAAATTLAPINEQQRPRRKAKAKRTCRCLRGEVDTTLDRVAFDAVEMLRRETLVPARAAAVLLLSHRARALPPASTHSDKEKPRHAAAAV